MKELLIGVGLTVLTIVALMAIYLAAQVDPRPGTVAAAVLLSTLVGLILLAGAMLTCFGWDRVQRERRRKGGR